MSDLSVERLATERLGEAYPLIRRSARVSRERWEDFARALLEQGGGVLAVTAGDSIHGVAAYRPAVSLRHETSLIVEVIATFELIAGAPARRALCSALEQAARTAGCRHLVFTMAAADYADGPSRRRSSWEDLGLEMETVSFVLPVGELGSA